MSVLFLHINYLAVYYTLYKFNTEGLTASCCEKKVANCNAHCYLEKKMNEEDSNSKKGTSSEIKLKLSEYVVADYNPDLIANKNNALYLYSSLLPEKDFFSEIEHPPQS